MSWVRFPSPAPTISPNRAIRSRLPSLLAAKPVVVYLHCHKLPKMRSPVLTNDPGIDISAAPPEFSSGELHSHTMPTLPRSSDLAACPGRGQNLKKVSANGTSRGCQSMANSPGSSDEKEKLSDRNLRFERNKRKGEYAFANDEACSNTER